MLESLLPMSRSAVLSRTPTPNDSLCSIVPSRASFRPLKSASKSSDFATSDKTAPLMSSVTQKSRVPLSSASLAVELEDASLVTSRIHRATSSAVAEPEMSPCLPLAADPLLPA